MDLSKSTSMSSAFYKSIIDDEIEVFAIKNESLKNAAKSVGMTYSRKALTQGQTFLDYNVPSYRCAYLYKYASIHTALVSKYFTKLLKKKIITSSLEEKETLKICCLGGGPGTDIVGLFKVLALIPCYHRKVVEVTILDICGGWRNSFKRVISNLISGKVKGVPDSFTAENFKFRLVEVNLLSNLPANVVSILSEADIVCMVKFVSAILGSTFAVSALEVIGEKLKVGAVVFFIDNFQGKVFKPLSDISGKVGLKLVMGPLHKSFSSKTGYKQGPITKAEKKLFGCSPTSNTSVTILGFIKCCSISNNNDMSPNNVPFENTIDDDDDDSSWDTDDEIEVCAKQNPKGLIKCAINTKSAVCLQTKHKFAQTSEKCSSYNMKESRQAESISVSMLNSLAEKLCELTNVLSIFQQRFGTKDCNCP